MFELLLQADKALADGALDQAERTYWQLIDLDPTNGIAVAGLARIALERGDRRLARTLADRALRIDPESIVARRVLSRIIDGGTELDEPAPSDLPLLAAERLEALSRRRSMGEPNGEPDARSSSGSTKGGKNKGAERPESRSSPSADASGKGADKAAAGTDNDVRGRTRPDQVVPLPTEPPRDTRQGGRLAAAAAAVREPAGPRHEPHHAMPMGRRLFGPDELKSPATDAFSAAEMAAAVEAVDAVDEAAPAEGEPTDALGAAEATEAGESVAMRIALAGGVAGPEAEQLEAAELEVAAPEAPEPDVSQEDLDADAFEAAEAVAVSESLRLAIKTTPQARDDAPDLAEAFGTPAGSAEAAADAAEALHEVAAATAEAAPETGAAGVSSPAEAPEPTADVGPLANGPSEENAEAEALREAMAIVLGGGSESRAGIAAAPATAPSAPAADSASPVVEPGPPNPAPSKAEPSGKDGPDVNTPRRKQGLFRRFRGS